MFKCILSLRKINKFIRSQPKIGKFEKRHRHRKELSERENEREREREREI